MAPCSSDGDCRSGYTCQDLSGKPKADGSPGNALGAVLADDGGNGKVCAATPIGTPPVLQVYDAGDGGAGPLESNGVCLGSGIPKAAAAGGNGGMSGMSGMNASSDAGAGGASGASNDAGAGG
jgi:hypothetical protein